MSDAEGPSKRLRRRSAAPSVDTEIIPAVTSHPTLRRSRRSDVPFEVSNY